MTSTAERLVTLAAVAGAHGIRGEVRLKLFTETLDGFTRHRSFEAGGRRLTLVSARPDKAGAIARFVEVPHRTAAEALRGATLAVPRSALPEPEEDEVYVADLIGLPATTTDGAEVGVVVGVENYGAGDIVEIEHPDGRRTMVPFTREAVPEVGTAVVVDPAFLV